MPSASRLPRQAGGRSGKREAAPARSSARKKKALRPRASFPWRPVLGLVLLLGVLPFLLVSLASPALAGLAGQRVARALFAGLGQTAWLLPFLVAAQALQMLGRVLSLRLGLASLLLFLDLALLGARMGGQGGALGGWLDGHLVPLVGPAGSWITALGGLVLGLCLVCRLEAHQVLEGVMFLLR
ncbi:MAG TPA: hypothetical protein VNO81_03325, partial [Candidatus Nitrosotenuis sp.]|nr:hypothetical protein [Candidatus Nitrosotenuis sp.]